MTFILGLTGSIGMGKSTTAQMFADEGVPVWNADNVVHQMYSAGGAAVQEIAALNPDVMTEGAVDRSKLRALIAQDPSVLDHVQKIVHPLVAAHRAEFLANADAPVVVLDVPLLYETGADGMCDGVVVVSVPAETQRQRVLDRGEMSEDEFQLILSRQMPDAVKRAKARWVIETLTLDGARQSVKDVLAEIEGETADA